MATDKRKTKGRKDDSETPCTNPHGRDETDAETDIESVVRRVIRSELDSFRTELKKWMDEKLDVLDKRVAAIERDSSIKDLRAENFSLQNRVDELEAFSRSDNLIIRGLPEVTYAERAAGSRLPTADSEPMDHSVKAVEDSVINFCHASLDIEITRNDISVAHRMKSSSKDTARPIIVRFTNRRTRDQIYRARKLLKGQSSKIFISEHLNKSSSTLFYEARKLAREKKIISTWTQNGQIFVRVTTDPTEKPTAVKSILDLNSRFK